MLDLAQAVGCQVDRQVAHWVLAAERLKLDDLASPAAWAQLERYLGVAVRGHLQRVLDRLRADAKALVADHDAAHGPAAAAALRARLVDFERGYLRAETTLDFFADAINARTNPQVGALLRACDTLAHRAMSQLLDRVGQPVPVVLTYLDKGRGASILKAGLRLWDGGEVCPVAVVKITHHNLLRTTALIHEAGHQVAHIAGWNGELAAALHAALRGRAGAEVAETWAGWASEIAADAFAFASTGFAAVAALTDVLAAEPPLAFHHVPGDPHPVSFLRVLLGAQMCRHAFGGGGPWEPLAAAWQALHPPTLAAPEVRALVDASLPLLDRVAAVALDQPMQAFGGQSLSALLRPERVSPRALGDMAARLGPALYTSPHWLWSEPLRILALTGLQLAESPRDFQPILERQRDSMLRLGAPSTPGP